MKLINAPILVIAFLFFWGCSTTQKVTPLTSAVKDDGQIEFTFLQINDVYEISPQEGGNAGGMARVAMLFQQLKKENPNTFFVMAGDFLNPSLYSTIKDKKGIPVKGRQMVETMNVAGVDLAIFGNHEFDLSEKALQACINISEFDWIASNTLRVQVDSTYPFKPTSTAQNIHPFFKEKNGEKEYIPETYQWKIQDTDGTELTIGLFTATIASNKKAKYVAYQDFTDEVVKSYLELNCSSDFILGLTHLSIREDMQVASLLPNVPLIMGGHEHKQMEVNVGNVKITKADANANTAWIHRFQYDKNTGTHSFTSDLIPIDTTLANEPATQKVVDHWEEVLHDKIKEVYPDPEKVIYYPKQPLDAATVRRQQTNLGNLLCQAIQAKSPVATEASIINSGAVRFDDYLEDALAAIDVFKILPFPGNIGTTLMKGNTLLSILKVGLVEKVGSGSYLQVHNLAYDEKTNTGTINGKPIDPNKSYSIGMNDYLLKGMIGEGKPLPKGQEIHIGADLRVAIINYLDSLPKPKGE